MIDALKKVTEVDGRIMVEGDGWEDRVCERIKQMAKAHPNAISMILIRPQTLTIQYYTDLQQENTATGGPGGNT